MDTKPDTVEPAPPRDSSGDATGAESPSALSASGRLGKLLFYAALIGLMAAVGLAVFAGMSLVRARAELSQVRQDQQDLDQGLGAQVAAAEAQAGGIEEDMARMRFAWDPTFAGQRDSLQQAADTLVCQAASEEGGDFGEAVAQFVTQEAPRQVPALAEVPGWASQLDTARLEQAWQHCGTGGS